MNSMVLVATVSAIWCVLLVTVIAGAKLIHEINKQQDEIEDLRNRLFKLEMER